MEDNTLISQFEKILNLENQSLSSDVFNNIKTNIINNVLLFSML